MGPGTPQRCIERLQPDKYLPHLCNGIDPGREIGSVGGHATGFDVQPDKPLVGGRDSKIGRLADDGRIGPALSNQRFGSGALKFLVRHGRQDEIASQAVLSYLRRGRHESRQSPFGIAGSPAVKPPFLSPRAGAAFPCRPPPRYRGGR